LELQRNVILYDALINSGTTEDNDESALSPMEKIAFDLAEIKSRLPFKS